MSLTIYPEDVQHEQDHSDPANLVSIGYDDYVDRSIECDRCGLVMHFTAAQWVFPSSQVQAWRDEHESCEPSPENKRLQNMKAAALVSKAAAKVKRKS